jgi:hypothetical protein
VEPMDACVAVPDVVGVKNWALVGLRLICRMCDFNILEQ